MNRSAFACGLLAALLLSGSSCSRNSKHPRQALDTGVKDALWALAPAGTQFGVVIAPGTGPLLVAAWTAVERSASRWPAVQEAMVELRSELPPEVVDAAGRTHMGMDIAGGAAVFMVAKDNGVMVLPVVDRAAFRRSVGATTEEVGGTTVDVLDELRCQDVAGHYACAEDATLLAALGKSDALARHVVSRSAALRGAVEFEATLDILPMEAREGLAEAVSGVGALQGAVQVAPGVITVRALLDGKPVHPLARTALQTPDTLSQQVARSQPGGFLRVRVPLDAQIAAGVAAGAQALGLTVDSSVLAGITGEVVLVSASGDVLDISLQVGAKDGKALQPIVTQLCQMAQSVAGPVPVGMDGDRCVARIEPKLLEQAGVPTGMGIERPLEIVLATSDTALIVRVSMAGKTPARGADMTALGRELLTEPWHVALWSRGNILRKMQSAPGIRPTEVLAQLGEAGESARGVIWVLAHLDEMGWGYAVREDGFHIVFHVGTHWANPDDVLRAYQALLDRLLAGVDIEAELAALAGKHPDTPLGQAYRAGPGGSTIVLATAGPLAAVAIPAFTLYLERTKSIEAERLIKGMHNGVRAYYQYPAVSDTLPRGPHLPPQGVGPTPPVGTCCASDTGKCAPNPALWKHPTWEAIFFSVDDEHRFSYQYEVLDGGKAFVARAIGDLDCDGVLSTFELGGKIAEDGTLQVSTEIQRINEGE